jgi:hypothetical protein
MKSKHSHPKHKREFTGCVELFPSQPLFIEFIDAHRIWAFPIQHLTHLVLQEKSPIQSRKDLPPDELVLVYFPALVVLHGWRLELLLNSLIRGQVTRIHAEKHLGALIIEEAWVAEIQVIPHEKQVLKANGEPYFGKEQS